MIAYIISDYTSYRIDIDKLILVSINVIYYRACRTCYSSWFVNYVNTTKKIDTSFGAAGDIQALGNIQS